MMDTNYMNLEKLVKDEIPIEFFKDFVQELPLVYKASHEHVFSNFCAAQARDLLPHVRRAKVDELLWAVAKRFECLKTSVCLNDARNCRHVRVRADSIVLTANAVNGPSEMVRRALFRDTLAESNQFLLFPEMDDRPRGDACFAMILHGPLDLDWPRVEFVYLAFPANDSRSYLKRINLASYCKVDLHASVREETIEDIAIAKLRRDALVQEG